MKKLDKLILQSFIGPFILTFIVVVFILLLQYMLKYFDDLVGKGLGFEVFAELLTYFSIVMTPNALPLAILLSSLMTFGNLGEHFELTAIKSSGISLLRTLSPIFYFSLGLTVLAFFSNNYVVPKAALNAYSLMYDVRQHKPAFDLKEGAFYNGIQGFSIKVDKKFSDGETLKDLIIYDHTKRKGNIDVIMADSGRMYTFMSDRYLVMELFEGHRYSEAENTSRSGYRKNPIIPYVRMGFDQTKMIFSLEDFDLKKTKKELFANNRLMKDIKQLNTDIDSMIFEIDQINYKVFKNVANYYDHHMKEDVVMPRQLEIVGKKLDSIRSIKDSIGRAREFEEVLIDDEEKGESQSDKELKPKLVRPESVKNSKEIPKKSKSIKTNDKALKTISSVQVDSVKEDSTILTIEKALIRVDSMMGLDKNKTRVVSTALSKARHMKNNMVSQATNNENLINEVRKYKIEKNKKYSLALACLVMFLIGAPLGSIIKKGGLGIPVIISVFFFIIFYVLNITGEKLAKQGFVDPVIGVWSSNFILLPFGLFFLRQARIDARLFDVDFYNVIILKIRRWLKMSEKE